MNITLENCPKHEELVIAYYVLLDQWASSQSKGMLCELASEYWTRLKTELDTGYDYQIPSSLDWLKLLESKYPVVESKYEVSVY